MTASDVGSGEKMIVGAITDESVALMRERIGYPNPTVRAGYMTLPWYTEATYDAIRHFAEGYGDDNPLYTTREYGAGTRWEGQIAPPGFEGAMGYNRDPLVPEELDRRTRTALRGVQLFHSGTDATYYRPIRPGDVLDKRSVVADVEEKVSEYAGKSVIVTNDTRWWNQRGEVVTSESHWYVHAERRSSASRSKYSTDTPAYYSDDELAEIEAEYEGEHRQGAEPLWWEDVAVGRTLPLMVKGPFTVTDLMNFHMGGGWYGYGNPPLRLAHENRKRLRGFYTRNEFNSWDVIQRIHWDREHAQDIGVASAYDIGPIRWSWLAHYCTNFCGDDGWVYKLRGEFRRFNYVGDTTRFTGAVVDKRVVEGVGPAVDLEFSGVNQRGDTNTLGRATILLPSREHGPVVLPEPPPLPTDVGPRPEGQGVRRGWAPS
jgi:acyl dehydratase